MKALLIAAGVGLFMGTAGGAVVRLPSLGPEPTTFGDFQTAHLAEDPGVTLHRLSMGSDRWEAPQPYIRVTYPDWVEEQAEDPADLTLADLRVPYVSPVPDSAEVVGEPALPPATTEPGAIQVAAFAP